MSKQEGGYPCRISSICDHLEEPEEQGEKELFLTEELEECVEGPDDGEMLVVRRALSGLAAPENQEQRKAILTQATPLEEKFAP